MNNETAIFAAGCFWGVEEAFRVLPGVVSTEVGYCGGLTEAPTYEQVCTGETNHAESVRIVFDPSVMSYQKLLDVFFASHNPTSRNFQGPDYGTQYRSVIFVQSAEQRELAHRTIDREQESGKWGAKKIVTEVLDEALFYPAEEYHQKYLLKQGKGSCHV